MGGEQVCDNKNQSGPSQGGQRQGTFVVKNINSHHAHVPLNQPNMVGIPSTPYAYMPNQPPMAGMPHYGNSPGYSQTQAPFSKATGAYNQGISTFSIHCRYKWPKEQSILTLVE